MLLLIPSFGCADPRVDRMEAKIAALEAELAAVKAAHGADLPPMASDVATGEVVPVLNDDAVTSCAFGNLQGLATAEAAYDAAFDKYLTDFATLGWAIDATRGCQHYLAVRVTLLENDRGRIDNFRGVALVTRGAGRGRIFEVEQTNTVNERLRFSESEVLAFLAEPGWTGSPR